MNRRERVQRVHFFLLAGGLVLFGAVVLIIAGTLREQGHVREFGRFIERIDRFMEAGDFEDALSLLKIHKSSRETSAEWLRLLKRSHRLASLLNRPEIHSDMAGKAVKAYPGNEQLRALAVLAHIDAGDSAGAGEAAEKYLHSRPYQSVKAEAFLRAGLGIKGAGEGKMVLPSLPESRDPLDFIRAAELTGESGYYLDGALLYLEEGKIKEAVEILTRPGVGERYPYPTALALFDREDFAAAESFASRIIPDGANFPYLTLFYSDLFLKTGRIARAKESYDALRAGYFGISPIPYLNTGIILRSEEPLKALAVLREGISLFPENSDIVFSLSKILLSQGSPETSLTILEAFEKNHGKNGDSELLRLLSLRDSLHTRRFVGELYLLRGLYPAHEALNRIIIWHLLTNKDYPGILGIIDYPSEREWNRLYRGVINFARRDYEAAGEEFRRMLAVRESAEGRYNLGLTLTALRDYGKALESFLEAEKDKTLPPAARSKIVVAIAGNYIRLRRYDEAQKILRKGLMENPGNPGILRTLGKLEGRPES
jgi:tetratricopeptide (TPR) repeat protein